MESNRAHCPPLTYGMLLRQVARENLVPEFEVLYDEPDGWGSQVSYLRCGDSFWCMRYTHTGLRYHSLKTQLYETEGVLVLPSREGGQMLALGDVADVQAAELTWTIQDYYGQTQFCTLTSSGERVTDQLLWFPLPEMTPVEAERQESLRLDAWPEDRFTYTLRLTGPEGTSREIRG